MSPSHWDDHAAVDRALFILPCITAPISLLSSSYVVYLISTKRRANLYKPREQILMGLSLLDISFSLGISFSTAPGPAVIEAILPTYGTVATCTAQAFFVQFGLGAPMYNACLCIYYLLSIRYKVSDETLMKCAVPCMHGFILIFSSFTSISGIFLGIFNYAGVMGCWIHNADALCKQDSQYCDRGQGADKFVLIFGLIHVGLCFIFVVISMVVLGITVRGIELRSRRWEFQNGRDNKSMPLTRRTIETGLLYSLTFVAIWLPTIMLGTVMDGMFNFTYRVVQIMSVTLQPLQGFFNMIIYTSPEWLPWFRKVKCRFFPCCCCCCIWKDGKFFGRHHDTSLDENDEFEEQDLEREISLDLFSVKDAIEDHRSREFVPMAQRRSARRARRNSRSLHSAENSQELSDMLSQLSSTFLRAELATLKENSREDAGSSTSDLRSRRSSLESNNDYLRRSSAEGSSDCLRRPSHEGSSDIHRQPSHEEVRYEADPSSRSCGVPEKIMEDSDDDNYSGDENLRVRTNSMTEYEMKVDLGSYEFDCGPDEEVVINPVDGRINVRTLQLQMQESISDSVIDSSGGTMEFTSSSECSTVHA